MTQPTILITIDYEISGNGTGDVRRLMIEPTAELMRILAAYKIQMTVFFEIEEFLIFQKYAAMLEVAWGYNPADEIELQLSQMVCAGHEIGLHLHPQWIGASYDGRQFILAPKNQCLSDVYKTEGELSVYLESRAAALTKLVRKYDPAYQIFSFRAGGHALRPEKMTLKILRKIGIKAESSVVNGLYRKGSGMDVDYRDAPPDLGYWRVRDNVCEVDPCGEIIEFPVYTRQQPEYKKLTINRIRAKFFSSSRPVAVMRYGLSRMDIPKTPWGLWGHLFKNTPLKFDFCHMTSSEMMSFLGNSEKPHYPLTMIGHSKEFFNNKEFSAFLGVAIKQKKSCFVTMATAINKIENGGI